MIRVCQMQGTENLIPVECSRYSSIVYRRRALDLLCRLVGPRMLRKNESTVIRNRELDELLDSSKTRCMFEEVRLRFGSCRAQIRS